MIVFFGLGFFGANFPLDDIYSNMDVPFSLAVLLLLLLLLRLLLRKPAGRKESSENFKIEKYPLVETHAFVYCITKRDEDPGFRPVPD